MPAQPPVPHQMAQALCDLIEDPTSGITRISVVGTSQRTVRRVRALAEERGLHAESACSPCDDRCWVRIEREHHAT